MDEIYGVIDVGSNSVRLMLYKIGKPAKKMSVNSRLAEGMEGGVLTDIAIVRTAKAVAFLCDLAKEHGARTVIAFATAAVRNAVNGDEFLRLVKELSGLSIEVLTGEQEARTGFMGALDGKDGGLIDVGGASSEVIVVKGGKAVYVKSLNIGAVKIKDACGQDKDAADGYIREKIKEYGTVPSAEFTAVGGTATSVAAMMLRLSEYNPERVDGFTVTVADLRKLSDTLFGMTVEERKTIKGLQKSRAEIIAGGALLLLRIAEMLSVTHFKVSEKDNLEGYLKEKVFNIEKKD